MIFKVDFLENEYFWGGSSCHGTDMPLYSGKEYCRDFRIDPVNQFMPLFLSSRGRYVWSEKPFKVWVDGSALYFEGEAEFLLATAGDSLRNAYMAAMEKYFPFKETMEQGKILPRSFFTTAQYNTWMEFTYFPTQEKVLDYAHKIVDNGFTPGILIIDEGWHTRYGTWEFDFAAFPEPKKMVDELHALGFKVMLWVTPLFTSDGKGMVDLVMRPDLGSTVADKIFLRNSDGNVAIVEWWEGYSAIFDLRKQADREYFKNKLDTLIDKYGVDGFKFDGGSYQMYHPSNLLNGTPADNHNPEELNNAWNEFGAQYEYHEYKDSYRQGGKAMIQRLCDRNHSWDNSGINTLVPSAIMQGLIGSPFICPDMIGGGEWSYRVRQDFKVDEELFIRMAQTSALFPMMQFSWAPWDALSDNNLRIIKKAAKLHSEMAEEIVGLVRASELSGEPILRNLEYNYPNSGYAEISDQFMLGNDILVCPIVTKGTFSKEVVLPKGQWLDSEGNFHNGGKTKVFSTPLDKLLWFKKA